VALSWLRAGAAIEANSSSRASAALIRPPLISRADFRRPGQLQNGRR
jgi:hypothetical protein